MDDGSDLIFVTGAPGSRWSAIAYGISCADGINRSDAAPDRSYRTTNDGLRKDRDERPNPLHFGNYFGPGMEFGSGFDRLPFLSKVALRREFDRPYAAPGGIKLVKGHVFARHLGLLSDQFPSARFVLVYRSDAACLDWWLRCGGFDIRFPDYSWYEDVENMRQQIALDNAGIGSFARERGLNFRRYRSFAPIFSTLRLASSRQSLEERGRSDYAAPIGHVPSDPGAFARELRRLAPVAEVALS